jgi:hypothetical protein
MKNESGVVEELYVYARCPLVLLHAKKPRSDHLI